ncbi:MAG TPA: thiamine pyrophosphate-dependent dehydrogenase E1 component subunit alpha [Bryobacteraceae bacterium]|jgi:TPP-dependent pyruvate/acetoin dehydrogenase alpha subunit
MEATKDLALALYRSMRRIREFELRLQQVYRSGVMPGFIHLYVGEEAVASGVCANLTREDYVTSTHRGHGHAIAKGVHMGECFAEIWGKTRGVNGGRGGSMHIYDPSCGFLGTNGIVGAGVPMASGAAMASLVKGSGQVAVSFFGDGAVNNCAFHEGINLAAALRLPAIFVCENNMYATETPFHRVTANTNVASRGAAYGLPGISVDGNDVLEIHKVAGEAIRRARAGDGPTLIECTTYRHLGHFEGDPGTGYRSKEEIAEWKLRDPIERLRNAVVASRLSDAQDLNAIDSEVDVEVEQAYQFAAASPEADAATVSQFVFA